MSTTVTATRYIHSPGQTTISIHPVRLFEMRGWMALGWDNPQDAQYDGGHDGR